MIEVKDLPQHILDVIYKYRKDGDKLDVFSSGSVD